MEDKRKHSASFIAVKKKVDEMEAAASLEETLHIISQNGRFSFVADNVLVVGKNIKRYSLVYRGKKHVITIENGNWWTNLGTGKKGRYLGNFIKHHFCESGKEYQDQASRLYDDWLHVIYNWKEEAQEQPKKPLILYNLDLLGWLPKDGLQLLEFPFFALDTRRKNLEIRTFEDEVRGLKITIIPSVLGQMNIKDKEVLIWFFSKAVELFKQGKPYQIIRTNIKEVLQDLGLSIHPKNYQRIKDSLDRLHLTGIKTNIKTGGIITEKAFNLIDEWTIIRKNPDNPKSHMIGIEVKLSDWQLRTIDAGELLALDPRYFKLGELERRIYEIIRKGGGKPSDITNFSMTFEKLYRYCGYNGNIRDFKDKVKKICDKYKKNADGFLGYCIKCGLLRINEGLMVSRL